MATFQEILARAQATLLTRLSGGDGTVQVDDLMPHLFYSGYSVGLTTKEIIQILLRPVVNELRPGLARP